MAAVTAMVVVVVLPLAGEGLAAAELSPAPAPAPALALAPAPAPASAGAAENRDGESLRPLSPDETAREFLGDHPVPFVSESLGLALYRPAETTVAGQRGEDGTSYMIAEDHDPPDWNLSIQHLYISSGIFDPEEQIDTHLERLREADRTFRVLDNQSILVNGIQGHLAFIELRNDPDGDSIVNGWLILPQGEDVLLVISMLVVPEIYPEMRPVFDAIFSTVTIRSTEEMLVRRMSRIETGRRLLEEITPEQLRELKGTEEWTRIYKRGSERDPDAEEEIGYAFLEIREGMRGELNPSRETDRYSDRDQERGLLVRLQGRAISDLRRNIFYDSLALYWLSWDMSEEAWTVWGTQRQGEAEQTELETGLRNPARTGAPRPLLTVVRDRMGEYARDPVEWQVPDAYLSQALGSVIGRLLPRDIEEPVEYAFYFYNYTLSTPQLTKRVDRWGPASDGSGNWELRTRLSSEAPVTTTTYSASGQLVRRVRADGTIIEPITLQQLHRLWERKGLPTGETTQRGRSRQRR